MPANPILDSANRFIEVTNYEAYEGTFGGVTRTLSTLDGIPLTTSTAGATGQLAVAAYLVGGSISPPSGGEYTSDPELVTADGTIPAGCLGWSFTVVSGTVTLNGSGTLPVGASFRGGGYTGYVLASALSYTIAAGSALVNVDNPQS